MKVFVYDISSYMGRAVVEAMRDEETQIYGSFVEGSPAPRSRKNIVSMQDEAALKATVEKCDLVVCHLLGNLNDVHRIFRVSSLVTWGKNEHVRLLSSPLVQSKEKPLLEENYKDRMPDEIFIPIKAMENTILEGSSEMLSAYVVATGVLYGRGEHFFDLMFKQAWLCMQEGVCVPCYSGFFARNPISTIHVSDVAKIVRACHENKPERHYIVALDKGEYSVRDVMSVISRKLGINRLVNWNDEEAERHLYVYRGIGTAFQLDLTFDRESLAVNTDLGIEWSAENGIVRHMPLVIRQFIREKQLFPQRIVLLGPPGAGKSFYARLLSEKYFLPIVTVPKAIEYAKENPKLMKLMTRCLSRKSNKTGRLNAPLLALVMRHMLTSPECRNKGYILDGYPRSYFEADCLLRKEGPDLEARDESESLKEEEEGEGEEKEKEEGGVKEEEEEEESKEVEEEESKEVEEEAEEEEEEEDVPEEGEEEETEDLTPDIDKKILPSSVIYLDESDDYLRERNEVEGTHNTQEDFSRRLALFRKRHELGMNQTTLTYFEVNCHLEVMPLKSSTELSTSLQSLELYIEKKKRPYNYHPTAEELQSQVEEENARREALRKQREEMQRVAESRAREERESLEKAHRFRIDEIVQQEQSLEGVRRQPTREYLMENVIPTLTAGLLETTKVKPVDEFDYLAEWLFQSIAQE